jgi:hypothetical protein
MNCIILHARLTSNATAGIISALAAVAFDTPWRRSMRRAGANATPPWHLSWLCAWYFES